MVYVFIRKRVGGEVFGSCLNKKYLEGRSETNSVAFG